MVNLEVGHVCDDEVGERRVLVGSLDEYLPGLTEDIRQDEIKLGEADLGTSQGICFEVGAVFRGLEGLSPDVGS